MPKPELHDWFDVERLAHAFAILQPDTGVFVRLACDLQGRAYPTLWINVSDVFVPGAADAEHLPWDELVPLAKRAFPLFGNPDELELCLIDWAVKERGAEPSAWIRERLRIFREKHPEACA